RAARGPLGRRRRPGVAAGLLRRRHRRCRRAYDRPLAPAQHQVAMIIAHDLGTTGDKASLHSADGVLIAATTVGYPTHYGTGGVDRAWGEVFNGAVIVGAVALTIDRSRLRSIK